MPKVPSLKLKPMDMVVSVAFSSKDKPYIDIATDLFGMTASQFFRQAAIEKLVAMKVMPNPMDKYTRASESLEA
jgi:hypothetical protein